MILLRLTEDTTSYQSLLYTAFVISPYRNHFLPILMVPKLEQFFHSILIVSRQALKLSKTLTI